VVVNVFTKTLRDLRRSAIGWSIGIASLVVIVTALWPSIRDMPDLEELLANYPAQMQELFDVRAITTAAGFLNAELFSMLLPALFIIFGVGRGAKLVAGEEAEGTLEVLVVTPVSRTRLLVDKALALAVAMAALGAVLLVTVLVASTAGDMGIPAQDAAIGTLAMVLVGLLHGWLALAVGAATGRRTVALVVAGTVAVAGYVLHVAGALVDAVAPWQPLSPFTQAVRSGPVGADLPLGFAWLGIGAVVLVVASIPRFARRDILTRA
jgi:ABC-2 type transport system permease protein